MFSSIQQTCARSILSNEILGRDLGPSGVSPNQRSRWKLAGANGVSASTGPLSDLRYRQVRLDLGFIVRMRARQAPLPPITADCHRLLPAIIVAWDISRGYGDKDIRLISLTH